MAYWRISTGRSPQPALSFPAAALASPPCGFQLRRPSCGGEWDAGVSAGDGEGVGLGTGQSQGRSGAGLGGGTAIAGVGWGDSKKRQSQMKQPLREAPVRHYLISYATAAAI